MSAVVLAAAVSLREALAGFEPGVLSGADCSRLAGELAATEKAYVELCPACGGQSISCGCLWAGEEDDPEDWVDQAEPRLQLVGSDDMRRSVGHATPEKNLPGTPW